MCLGTVASRAKIEIGYKFFTSYDKCLYGPFYNNRGGIKINEWNFPSNLGNKLDIPPFVSVKDKKDPTDPTSIYQRNATNNPTSKYQDYLSGFHILPTLKAVKSYKDYTSGTNGLTCYKCEYLGVLATGYDYSSQETLKNRVRCVVALAIRPIAPITL